MFKMLLAVLLSFGAGVVYGESLAVFKDVEISSSVDVLDKYMIKNVIAFSSVPVMTFGGFSSTLGSGTTFSAYVPTSPIILKGINVTISNKGGTAPPGSITFWYCSDGVNSVRVQTPIGPEIGSFFSSKDYKYINGGRTVSIRMESALNLTPSANVVCEYSMQ